MLTLGAGANGAALVAAGEGYDAFIGAECLDCSEPWGEFGLSTGSCGWVWGGRGCSSSFTSCWEDCAPDAALMLSTLPMPMAAVEDGDCDIFGAGMVMETESFSLGSAGR